MSALHHILYDHARQRPGELALDDGTTRLTYAALPEAVTATATALAEALADRRVGAPVGVLLDNGVAWVLIDLALMLLGRPSVPVPPFFSATQRAHALRDAGATALVVPSGAAGPDVRPLVVAGAPLACQLLDSPSVDLPAGTAKITYTSGSTGAPKGVCLSLDGQLVTAQSIVAELGAAQAGIHLPVLPLAVLLENVAGLYAILLAGGTYRPRPAAALGLGDPFRPDFLRLMTAIEETGATSLILVPELLRGLMAAMAASGRRLPRLTLIAVGGARVAPALLNAAAGLGLPVMQGYGLSECASVVTLNTPSANRPGSVGRPLPHVRLTLAADGEIIIENPAFLGYVGTGAPTPAYATGDIGRIDEDGYVYFDGRKDNVIVTGFGRNVAPEWLEAELQACRGIAQAMVCGTDDGLVALVVPVPGTDPAGLAAMIDGTNARLPAYARLARWHAVAPFTLAAGHLTGNGRPRRAAIIKDHQPLLAACAKEMS